MPYTEIVVFALYYDKRTDVKVAKRIFSLLVVTAINIIRISIQDIY